MHRLVASLLLGICTLPGCTTSEVLIPHAIELDHAQRTIPEEQLLDVGVTLFDPGVPEGRVDKAVQEQLLEDGVFIHIRRTESVYMAVQLKETLQRSGHWGNVLITPEPSTAADVSVEGRILQSDGDIVRVDVEVVDAAGREWIDKLYEYRAPAAVYNTRRYGDTDPYQDLFNLIANDLAAAQAKLSGAAAREIRTVAQLRYARELSPLAFDGYVAESGRGTYEPSRLPAVDDPMFRYTKSVRQREQIFLETLDLHYRGFAFRAASPYGSWRAAAREESMAMRELKRSIRWRRALGIAAMVASVASAMNGGIADDPTGRVIQDSLMMMGAGMLEMSTVRMQESELHADALEEVSQSFDDEVKPLVVEIAGTQHRLTGTAEMQYAEWRELLRRVFAEQTGLEPPRDLPEDGLGDGDLREICLEEGAAQPQETASC